MKLVLVIKHLFGYVLVLRVSLYILLATRIYNSTISQSPLYIELDKTTNRKAVVVNGTTTTATNATEVSFSGNGTARGVNYTDSGKGLIIPRENGVISVKGM
jgi:hypothetical protein